MNTKYKIRTDISKTFRGKTIYRIEALKDFGDVKKGDFGGWIEKEFFSKRKRKLLGIR